MSPVWQISDDKPVKINPSDLESEKGLEDWITADPNMLLAGMEIVGRQVHIPTKPRGQLDLLGLDLQGRWHVIELKKGILRRDAIAQALDYAAHIARMPFDRLAEVYRKFGERYGPDQVKNLEELFEEKNIDLESEDDERDVQIMVVGTDKDQDFESVAEFLSSKDFPFRFVTFETFALSNGEQVLFREELDNENDLPLENEKAKGWRSNEEIKLAAKQAGGGEAFDYFFSEAVDKLNFYPRPYKRRIMFTPPWHKNRCLVLMGYGKGTEILVSLPGIAELYSVPAEDVVASFRAEGIAVDEWQYNLTVETVEKVSRVLMKLTGQTE